MQSAYEIRVARSERGARGGGRDLVWDVGHAWRRTSRSSAPTRARRSQSGQRYHWQVRVWDGGGTASAWSAPAWWEMGLLEPSDWKASWIEPDLPEDVTTVGPAPMLRREFKLSGAVERARAYVTSHGLYELHLNGRRVGDQLFTPGLDELQQAPAVPDLRRHVPAEERATTRWASLLGNGWYRGNLAWERPAQRLRRPAGPAAARSRSPTRTGARRSSARDASWKAATGPDPDVRDLPRRDLRRASREAGLDARPASTIGEWSAVKVASHRKDDLVAPAGPPVRRIEELKPVKIFKTPAGDTVVDMGQNMVGWVRLKVAGARGHDRHAAPRRGARQGGQLLHGEPAHGEGDGAATR